MGDGERAEDLIAESYYGREKPQPVRETCVVRKHLDPSPASPKSASAQGWKRAHEDPLPRVRLKTAERGRLCAELGALYWRLGLSRLSLAFAGNRAIGAVNLQGRLRLPTWESLQDAIRVLHGVYMSVVVLNHLH